MSSSKRPTSARPVAQKRSSLDRRQTDNGDSRFVYECKAGYLALYDDLSDNITSRQDLAQALQQTGRNPTKKHLDKYWRSSAGSVSFDDFVEICHKEPATSEDDLLKAFRKMDLNGDGYISNKELKKVLTSKGEKMTMSEVEAIIDEVDENRDGRLDYKEFCKMVLSTQNECRQLAMKHMEAKMKKSSKPPMSKSSLMSPRPTSEPESSSEAEEVKDEESGEEEGQNGSLGRSAVSPRSKDRIISPVANKDLRLQKPKNLRDWRQKLIKGCFFIEEDSSIFGHQYTLELPRDSTVWITLEPYSLRPGGDLPSSKEAAHAPIDTMLFILRRDRSLVTFTEQRDAKGRYGVRCDLERGTYRLVPFSTGCRLRPRKSEPSVETKLVRKKEDGYVLTKAFKEALGDVFQLCDLDGNDTLSRDEFNWFNQRTSGEAVADAEWEVVEEKLDLKQGEITRAGFIQLNQMEADDNEGDTEELWVTLATMGFSRDLTLDEACPFIMEVFSEKCEVDLTVSGLESSSKAVHNAVIDATIGKGECSKVKQMRDLFLHTYVNDFSACLVVENKSRSQVTVSVDCSKSKNCTSHTGSLVQTARVPAKSATVIHHLMPVKETQEWSLKVQEDIVK